MNKTLPNEIMNEIAEVLQDPEKFISLLEIQDKYSGKIVPFKMNEEQIQLLEILKNHRLVIIIKPRQIGVSTLLRAWGLRGIYTTNDPLKFGVVSFHDRSAKGLRNMDRVMYNSLPSIFKRKLALNNSTTMSFEDTGAELSSFTAGSKGGTRSFTLNAAHLSEFAFYEDPDEYLANIMATVGDGQVIIESTANVPGDKFHKLILGAPENGWKLVTFWWWQHSKFRQEAPHDFEPSDEERQLIKKYNVDYEQLYWRRCRIATMGLTKFQREYPACIEDAFHYASASYFNLENLRRIQEVYFEDEERIYNGEKPRTDDIYAMGVDVGGGVGLDYSAITVVSMATKQPVYHWRSNTISPSNFADKVLDIAQWYNDARVLCESNNHGHVVIYRLRHYGYKNLWMNADGKDWVTSTKSKLDAYETLREYVNGDMIDRMCAQVLSELSMLIIQRVTPEAPKGLNDDMAMSMALAYRCMREIPERRLEFARRNTMDMLLSRIKAESTRSQAIPFTRSE